MQLAILTDVTKCIGCRECVIACKRQNRLAPDFPRRWGSQDGLSALNWTSIVESTEGRYVRKHCRHCLEPACVAACPVGALRKTASGPVTYDPQRCMGCRYCMMACPFGIPRYDWDQPAPYVRKCTMCFEQRIRFGREPACTQACPTKATIFGERRELIHQARNRIRRDPGRYIDRVWGEDEVGGTSVLYISDVDLSFLSGGVQLGDRPLPDRTRLAMNAVPFAFAGVAAAMACLRWVIDRRIRLRSRPEEPGSPGGENNDA